MITPEQYKKYCLELESNDYRKISNRLSSPTVMRLIHGMLGLCTETGELQDVLKKHIFYGKGIDFQNIKEELGDMSWYMSILLDALGITWEEMWEANMKKLHARYGNKFSEDKANNRDLVKEEKALSGLTKKTITDELIIAFANNFIINNPPHTAEWLFGQQPIQSAFNRARASDKMKDHGWPVHNLPIGYKEFWIEVYFISKANNRDLEKENIALKNAVNDPIISFANEFLAPVDLITTNALYNDPAKTPLLMNRAREKMAQKGWMEDDYPSEPILFWKILYKYAMDNQGPSSEN